MPTNAEILTKLSGLVSDSSLRDYSSNQLLMGLQALIAEGGGVVTNSQILARSKEIISDPDLSLYSSTQILMALMAIASESVTTPDPGSGGDGGSSTNAPSGIRQTVISGPRDANGIPNAIANYMDVWSSGTDRTAKLTASVGSPFKVSFSAGDEEFVETITSDLYWTYIYTNNSYWAHLYIDRDPATGAITTGYTEFPPAYRFIEPTLGSLVFAQPVSSSGSTPGAMPTDQHWFDRSTNVMKQWNGTSWVTRQRVFVGIARRSGSILDPVYTFAYQGMYLSPWINISGGNNYVFNHALGLDLSDSSCRLTMWGRVNSSDPFPQIIYGYFENGATGYGANFNPSLASFPTVAIGLTTGTYPMNQLGWQSSCQLRLAISRGW